MAIVPFDLIPSLFDKAQLELEHLQDNIFKQGSLTDRERDDIWQRVSSIRTRCLSFLEPQPDVASEPLPISTVEKIAELDKRVSSLFFLTFASAPILSIIEDEDGTLHSEGRTSRNLFNFKSRFCKHLFAVLHALHQGDMQRALQLHDELPVDIKWAHYRNLSRIMNVDDPDGMQGKLAFRDLSLSCPCTDEQKMQAVVSNFSPFYFEMLHSITIGDTEVARVLSHLPSAITPWDDNVAFIAASRAGRMEILSSILARKDSLVQTHLNVAFIFAAMHGRLDVIELFYEHKIDFDAQTISMAMEKAASFNQLAVYLYLLPHSQQINTLDLNNMTNLSILNRDMVAFNALLSVYIETRDKFIHQIFNFCIDSGSIDFFQRLLLIANDHLRTHIGPSLVLAAGALRNDIIGYLIQHKAEDVASFRESAMLEALRKGNYAAMAFIFPSRYFHDSGDYNIFATEYITEVLGDLSLSDKEEIFTSACYVGNIHLVDLMLSQMSPLDDDVALDSMKVAITQSSSAVVRKLLSHSALTLSDEKLKDCLALAVTTGQSEIVAILLTCGRLTDFEGIEQQFVIAHDLKHYDVMKLLLYHPVHIARNELVRCFMNDASRGDFQALSIILSHIGRLSDEEIGTALWHAARLGQDSMARYLLSLHPDLPTRHLEWAVLYAAEHGNIPLFSHLTEKRDFSESVIFSQDIIQKMVLHGARSGYKEIVAFFVHHGAIYEELRDFAISQTRQDPWGEIRSILSSARILPDPDGTLEDRDYDMNIDLSHLNAYPLDYLESICSYGLPRRLIPISSPQTIDAGGVSKDFITNLVRALLDKGVIHLTSNKFPIDVGSDLKVYELLGKLCSILYKQNTSRSDPFLIGSVFHLKFFDMLKHTLITSQDKIIERVFCRILKEEEDTYEALFDYFLEPENKEKRHKFEMIMPHLGLEGPAFQAARELLKSFIRPLRVFSRGLSAQLRDVISSLQANDLSKKIQGIEASVDQLCAALHMAEDAPLAVHQRILWIKEWIAKVDDAKRKDFLHAVTGARHCPANIDIRVGASDSEHPIYCFSTCNSRMNIPLGEEISQEDFERGLECAIQNLAFNAI